MLQTDIRKSIVILSLSVTFLTGCAKFGEGDCIQDPKNGYIWRITAVHFNKYKIQGWLDGKWGLPVDGSSDTFDPYYVKISCPFSTQTLQENSS
jgi:hypothetical protein